MEGEGRSYVKKWWDEVEQKEKKGLNYKNNLKKQKTKTGMEFRPQELQV